MVLILWGDSQVFFTPLQLWKKYLYKNFFLSCWQRETKSDVLHYKVPVLS